MKNFQFKTATPESQGISSGNIIAFLDRCSEEKIELHSLHLTRNGYLIAEGYAKPHSAAVYHRIHSAAKTLCSIAILFAVQDGILSIDDPVTEIFRNHLPENLPEGMDRVTIYHLMTMSSGHDSNLFGLMMESDDWIKTFLSQPLTWEPGVKFEYNNGTPHLLGEVIHKTTGKSLTAYLEEKLFSKIGANVIIGQNDQGEDDTSTLSTYPESFTRISQFLLQEGRWDGRQLLDAGLVQLIGQCHLPKEHDPLIPKNILERGGYGYGLHTMRNAQGGYRMPGGRNQLGVIFPEHSLNFTICANEPRKYFPMQAFYETIFDNLYFRPVREAPEASAALKQRLSDWTLAPSGSDASGLSEEIQGKTYTFKADNHGIRSICFSFRNNRVDISINERWFCCGLNGEWLECSEKPFFQPSQARLNFVLGHDPSVNLYSAAWQTPDTLAVNRRSLAREATDFFSFKFTGDKLVLKTAIDPQGAGSAEFTTEELTGFYRNL